MEKKKVLSCSLSAALVIGALSACTLNAAALTPDVFTEEYKATEYYSKLAATIKEKTKEYDDKYIYEYGEDYGEDVKRYHDLEEPQYLTDYIALSQVGYNGDEYSRWAENYVLQGAEKPEIYNNSAVFASWCLYQAGYYRGDDYSEGLYSVAPFPVRVFFRNPSSECFGFDQILVYYSKNICDNFFKIHAVTRNNTDLDPYLYTPKIEPDEDGEYVDHYEYIMPYPSGGLVFFDWDGAGDGFDDVGIIINCDRESHVLTYVICDENGEVVQKDIELTRDPLETNPSVKKCDVVVTVATFETKEWDEDYVSPEPDDDTSSVSSEPADDTSDLSSETTESSAEESSKETAEDSSSVESSADTSDDTASSEVRETSSARSDEIQDQTFPLYLVIIISAAALACLAAVIAVVVTIVKKKK